MQASELIKYIGNPQLMDEKSLAHLQRMTADFPYFQPAHILLSLAAKKWDASVYQQSLRKTAIVVSNRSHLFRLIHQFENATVEETKTRPAETPAAKADPGSAVQTKEETRHELDILKAAELAVEQQPEEKQPEPMEIASPEDRMEIEIGKQLVQSFVEKEVLKTHEAHEITKKTEPPVSFNDWLTYVKNQATESAPVKQAEPIEKAKEKPVEKKPDASEIRKQKNKAIIDRIIESSPGLIKAKEEQKFYTPDNKAKESLQDNEHLVTETLAKIYALQGNVNKAVRAYEILSLKFPQKSAYFASLIQKLKNNK